MKLSAEGTDCLIYEGTNSDMLFGKQLNPIKREANPVKHSVATTSAEILLFGVVPLHL